MKDTIVITDLTQMKEDRVCIAGINRYKQCIRPVVEGGGIHKADLFVDNKLAIFPRAQVSFDFDQVPVESPHIEDMRFAPNSLVHKGTCDEILWEKVLRANLFDAVEEIYDGLIQEHRWVDPDANTRSMGTLQEATIEAVNIRIWPEGMKSRISFRDKKDILYDLPISDLAFRELVDAKCREGYSPTTLSQRLEKTFKVAHKLYLRLGLTRPWFNPDTGKGGCWIQVTGIHTFPDYLKGKTFADFWLPE